MADRSHRLFFALWPDAAVRACLARLARDIVRRCGGRVVAEENLHLTLAFLGNIDGARLAALYEAAEDVRADPFTLTIDRVGFWPRQHLAWAGCEALPTAGGELIRRLHAALQARDFPVEARPFVPHITLARHVHCATARLARPISWAVTAFRLVESTLQREGSRYASQGEWLLGPREERATGVSADERARKR